jgi:hypothetical protein
MTDDRIVARSRAMQGAVGAVPGDRDIAGCQEQQSGRERRGKRIRFRQYPSRSHCLSPVLLSISKCLKKGDAAADSRFSFVGGIHPAIGGNRRGLPILIRLVAGGTAISVLIRRRRRWYFPHYYNVMVDIHAAVCRDNAVGWPGDPTQMSRQSGCGARRSARAADVIPIRRHSISPKFAVTDG